MAVHGVVLAMLLLALGRGHRPDREEAPTRLVYVEPVAPAAMVTEPAAPASVVVPPEAPAKAVVSVPAVARKPVVAEPLTASRKPKAAREVAPDASRDAANAAAPTTADAGVRDGGGSAGAAAGSLGGLGDSPVPLQAVAVPPELVTRVVPEYPPRARALGVEGQVIVEVVLDRDGHPESEIRVVQSVALLDAAAVAAVRQWRFRPARDASGRSVRVIMQVPVRFVLR